MSYYLQMGYGLAMSSYSGSDDSICMGLTQGSRAAPCVWTAVSTVIVGAYKQRGFGARLVGGWSQDSILLSALIYMDDTDLFWAQLPTQTGSLGTSSHNPMGASLAGHTRKPEANQVLLVHTQYRFNKGTAELTPKKHLLQHKLTLPQTNGSRVEITLKDPMEASEVLCVLVSPDRNGEPMLTHMITKGYKWSQHVQCSKLLAKDAWFSFKTQAMMSI